MITPTLLSRVPVHGSRKRQVPSSACLTREAVPHHVETVTSSLREKIQRTFEYCHQAQIYYHLQERRVVCYYLDHYTFFHVMRESAKHIFHAFEAFHLF